MNGDSTPLQWVKIQFLQGQKSLVRYLEKKERSLSQAQKKLYFFLFVTFFGGFFLFSLVAGLVGHGRSAIRVSPIKLPLGLQQVKNDTIKFKK